MPDHVFPWGPWQLIWENDGEGWWPEEILDCHGRAVVEGLNEDGAYASDEIELLAHLLTAVPALYGALLDRGEGRLPQYDPDVTRVDVLLDWAADYLAELGAGDTGIRMLRDRAAVVRAALAKAQGADDDRTA